MKFNKESIKLEFIGCFFFTFIFILSYHQKEWKNIDFYSYIFINIILNFIIYKIWINLTEFCLNPFITIIYLFNRRLNYKYSLYLIIFQIMASYFAVYLYTSIVPKFVFDELNKNNLIDLDGNKVNITNLTIEFFANLFFVMIIYMFKYRYFKLKKILPFVLSLYLLILTLVFQFTLNYEVYTNPLKLIPFIFTKILSNNLTNIFLVLGVQLVGSVTGGFLGEIFSIKK